MSRYLSRPHLSRRGIFAGICLCGFAHPAFAQFDIGKLARMAKSAAVGETDELAWGKSLYGPFVDAMGGSYKNAAVQTAIGRLADPLVKTSARPFAWEVTVIDSNEVNAWCLPGGKIGVNKGLLRYVDNEDELAAVIAHEMGHAELSHAAKEIRAKALTGIAVAGASAASSNDRGAGTTVGLAAADLLIFNLAVSGYSREAEREADAHIATVFAKSGNDLSRGCQFYDTLLQVIPNNSKGRTSLFAGHPQTQERLDALKKVAGPPKLAAPVRPDFAFVKTAFPTRKIWMRSRS